MSQSSPVTETLDGCPFCGSRCVTLTVNPSNWPIVQCDDCGSCGPCISLKADQAVTLWNNRGHAQKPKEPCVHDVIIGLDGRWHCQTCAASVDVAVAHSSTGRQSGPTPGFRLIEEPCEHHHCEFPSCGCEVPISSPDRCQVCGEPADLTCGPSRFGDKTWACKDCWEPDTRPDRTPQESAE